MIHKSFHRLRQVYAEIKELGNQGTKLIAANLVEMRAARWELEADVKEAERQGDFPKELRVGVEDLLEAVTGLEQAPDARQDVLEDEERAKRVDLQQRPRLRFSVFQGKIENYDVFARNAERIF